MGLAKQREITLEQTKINYWSKELKEPKIRPTIISPMASLRLVSLDSLTISRRTTLITM